MIELDELIEETSNIRLLYVEDDISARESIRLFLEEFFTDIVVAEDGQEGFEKFQENDIDLIITDINMPRLNGLEMVQKIREIDKSVPTLIFSAYSELEYFIDSIKLGVDGYLLKPFDIEQFINSLQGVLAKIQLKKTEEKLQENYHYLQSIIDGVNDPILVIKEDYSVDLMNSKIKESMHYKNILDPNSPKCYEILHNRSSPCEDNCPLRDVMQDQKHTSVRHTQIDNNDKPYSVEISVTPLLDKQGVCDGIIAVPRDITGHLKIQETLRIQKDNLHHQARHDSLTGLGNRLLFEESLDEFISISQDTTDLFALFFIDLDKFKQINDTLGHKVGDKVLQEASNRLDNLISEDDTLARLGGDEFTIIMKVDDYKESAVLGQKILVKLEEVLCIDEHKLYISSSIGISLYPKDDTDATNLIKYADIAMYKAKESGRNNYKYYSSL